MKILRVKSIVELKRPIVLFALIFAFSTVICAIGQKTFLFPAIMGIAVAGFAVIYGVFRKNSRKMVFAVGLSVSLFLPAFLTSAAEFRVHTKISGNAFTSVSKAVVSDKWDYDNKTVIFATLSSKEYNGTKAAIFFDSPVVCEKYDVLSFEGIPFETKNSKSFDHYTKDLVSQNRLLAKNCFISFYAKNISVEGRIPESDRNLTQRYYFYINDSLKNVCGIFGGVDTFSYAKTLLCADRASVPYETENAFSRSGLLPILCISGLHVVICCSIIEATLKKLKFSKYLTGVILLVFLVFMVIITGAGGSVVRAAVMYAIVILAGLLKHSPDKLSALAIAYIVLSLFRPYCIFDIGTQLSFLGMTGIICAFSCSDRLHNERILSIINIKNSLIASFFAGSFVLIPLCYLFDGAYIFSPFSNLFAAVVFTPLMFFLVLLAVFCFLPQSILFILALPVKVLIFLLDGIANIFSQIPFSFTDFVMPEIAVVLCILFIVILYLVGAFGKNTSVMMTGLAFSVFANLSVLGMHLLSFICG